MVAQDAACGVVVVDRVLVVGGDAAVCHGCRPAPISTRSGGIGTDGLNGAVEEDIRKRFEREARLLDDTLDHPNIIDVIIRNVSGDDPFDLPSDEACDDGMRGP